MTDFWHAPPFWLEVLAVVAATFVLTVVLTRPLIAWLSAREFGKVIRADGPAHGAKAGTPTMGGLAMLAAIGLAGVYTAWRLARPEPLVILAGMAAFAVLGLLDDRQGLARRSGAREFGIGLTARRMFTLQVLLGLAVCVPLVWSAYPDQAALARLAAGAFTAIVLVATVNGVNMSDGLDGLAAGLCAIAFATAAVLPIGIAVLWNELWYAPYPGADALVGAGEVGRMVLALATAAGCLGFLVYNRHPARVFMGNVTSMALGAGLALSYMSAVGQQGQSPAFGPGLVVLVFLSIVGAVFYAEVASDLLQIGYFKLTGGRRLFRMAPLHHHFELLGWHETRVVKAFWLAGASISIIGVLAFVALILWV